MAMRKIALFVCCGLLVACCAFAQETQTQPARYLAIRNVSLIDATGAPLHKDMTVLIHGNRIETIGKSGKMRIPAAAQGIDGSGKFLIPGLWDMHVHWNGGAYLPLCI